MAGYVPGEQPKDRRYVKLNTNENPYPPSPEVAAAMAALQPADFARYPDPVADDFRDAAAAIAGVDRDWVIAGNGSDDILTIAIRSFVDDGGTIATVHPTYSLYPVLADIQGATTVEAHLQADFSLPKDLLEQVADADLLFLARPNAPTGNCYPIEEMKDICRGFDGPVLIDEAYVDFADDSCIAMPREFPNAIVSRTLSKSYSLAGLRLGFAVAQPDVIFGMMKVKDSYNINRVSQALGAAALRDQDHLQQTVASIRTTRRQLAAALTDRGFDVVPSQANFLFAKPPMPAKDYFDQLKENGVLVRYFGSSPRTSDYVRITIGTDDEMQELLRVTDEILKQT